MKKKKNPSSLCCLLWFWPGPALTAECGPDSAVHQNLGSKPFSTHRGQDSAKRVTADSSSGQVKERFSFTKTDVYLVKGLACYGIRW